MPESDSEEVDDSETEEEEEDSDKEEDNDEEESGDEDKEDEAPAAQSSSRIAAPSPRVASPALNPLRLRTRRRR